MIGRIARVIVAAGLAIAAATPLAAQPAPAGQPRTDSAPAAQTTGRTGGLVVPAGTRVRESIVLLRGPIDVFGTVDGSVMTLAGDVVVHPGAVVDGNVTSGLGTVRVLDGARVTGSAMSMTADETPPAGPNAASAVAPSRAAPADTWHQIKLVLGWLTVLIVIGFGVLVTASPYLDGVAETFEGSFARALGVGIVGQMLVLPALLALVVALALTIVGVLAIPLGVVAFIIAVAGLLTLGFLAVAFVTGRSLVGGERGPARRKAASARGESISALALGLGVYLAIWLASAAFTSVPTVAVVLRTVALATTWVAVTAGFGAALISRAGTRSQAALAVARARESADRPYQSAVPGWQTPTPVSGVVAARRPTSTPPARD